jgi:hypothetical protein
VHGNEQETPQEIEESCPAPKVYAFAERMHLFSNDAYSRSTAPDFSVAADGNPAKAFVQNRVDLDPPVSTNPLRHWTGALRGGEPGIGGQ